MNTNLTEIIVILDRSGSMASIKQDMEQGFAAFVADQAKEPGECRMTLVQFDGGEWGQGAGLQDSIHIDTVFENVPIKDVPTYVLLPRGNTPLLDAVGTTIDRVGQRLSATPEDRRPGRVLVMIVTDGGENASKTYSQERIKAMVQHQSDVYQWEFTYLGANVNEFTEAQSMAIATNSALGYDPTATGVQIAFAAASNNAKLYRATGQKIDYSAEDRLKAKKTPSTPTA